MHQRTANPAARAGFAVPIAAITARGYPELRPLDGQEVDGVIQLADGRVILLEVKASQTYRSEHFAPMKRLAESLGDRMIAGIVLSLSDHPYRYADKLWGLPVSALWENVSSTTEATIR